jgi:hypothetical protein
MADPVSWLMIEPGWHVVEASGEDIGRVEAVTGDSNADIFDGLSIASGMFSRPKYVPSEQVGEITDGRVQLTIDRAAIDALGEYDVPAASEDVEPEKASYVQRAEADLEHANLREHRTGVVRRILDWFGLAGRR